MGFEKIAKLMEMIHTVQMLDKVIALLRRPARIKKELEQYYKEYPIWSWLAQKIYYFGWGK